MFENKVTPHFVDDDINEEYSNTRFGQKKVDFWVEAMRSIGIFFTISRFVNICKHKTCIF